MNLEDPMHPTPPQQMTPPQQIPQGQAPQADTPMDEFEYTGKGSTKVIGNVLKLIKFGGIALGLIVVIGLLAIAASKLLAPKQPDGNITASETPQASITATPKPQVTYPTEYDEVQKLVEDYDKNINTVNENRTRIEVPQFKFGIQFDSK